MIDSIFRISVGAIVSFVFFQWLSLAIDRGLQMHQSMSHMCMVIKVCVGRIVCSRDSLSHHSKCNYVIYKSKSLLTHMFNTLGILGKAWYYHYFFPRDVSKICSCGSKIYSDSRSWKLHHLRDLVSHA